MPMDHQQSRVAKELNERKTHSYEVRKESLFRMVDDDGSGTIDKHEFGKLFDVIKEEATQEIKKEQALKETAEHAQRRVRFLFTALIVLIAFLALSVASNFGVVMAVVSGEIKTTTATASDGGTRLTDKEGHVLQTQAAMDAASLTDLPALYAAGEVDVDRLNWISFNDDYGAHGAYRVSGLYWYNSTDMDIILAAGATLVISGDKYWTNWYHELEYEDEASSTTSRRELRQRRKRNGPNPGGSGSPSNAKGTGSSSYYYYYSYDGLWAAFPVATMAGARMGP